MATSSQHSVFTVNKIVKCRGKVCLITNINNELGYNRYTAVNIDTGEKIVAIGFQLQHCDEIDAVLLPAVDVFDDDDDIGESAAAEATAKKPSAVGTDGSRWATMRVDDIDGIAKNRHSLNTANQTKWAVGVFREWLVHQEKDPHFEQANVEDLAANLRTFYACARSADGNLYSKSSLTNLRAGLNRYLTSPPYSRQINLMHDIAFQSANQVFVGMVRKLRQHGLDKTRHKDAIRASDMKKLYECGTLSTDDPVGLQRKVYIEVCLHFCRRGKEGLRELRKESFVIQRDENEREYVTLGYNELENNHQGINKHDIAEEPRMYSQRGDVCPVESFKKYISKLNENCSAFFQRPNLNYRKSGQWYCNVPIGKNTLATMMKTISEAAGLSKKYTNHCLRVTAISVLSAQGVEDRDICSVSRHKNPGSLKPYCPGPDDEKRFSMSSKLHGHGKPNTALIPVASQSATSPKPSTSRGLPEIELDVGDSQSAVVPAVTPTADTATHGPIANSNTAISNRSDNIVQRALFAGAHFEANCAPVFHFHGNFNFN